LAAGVLALIGGLAAACFAKVYGVAFLGRPRSSEAGSANEVSLPMQLGMGVLATACVVIGIFPSLVLRSLGTLTEELLPGRVTQLTDLVDW
jgi:hydrogenase-4 component B